MYYSGVPLGASRPDGRGASWLGKQGAASRRGVTWVDPYGKEGVTYRLVLLGHVADLLRGVLLGGHGCRWDGLLRWGRS